MGGAVVEEAADVREGERAALAGEPRGEAGVGEREARVEHADAVQDDTRDLAIHVPMSSSVSSYRTS